jgi:xanthine dehydrogenase accessory factor
VAGCRSGGIRALQSDSSAFHNRRSLEGALFKTVRSLLPEIERWQQQGKRVALATVVKVWGSAPRPLGSKMAMTGEGDMAGSVSGGCVEAAVADEARKVLASGEPKLVSFGVSDDTAWAVGLTCGGQIEVFIEPLD